MTDVLLTLGSIRFSMDQGAFNRLSRTLEIRTAKMERAGAQTARQVLGEDETIAIEGTVYPAEKGGLARLPSFRALARTYAPQLLTDGMGNVWGQYVIERVEEEQSYHLPNGAPLKQTFRINLGAYGADS
jgi:phage protein U